MKAPVAIGEPVKIPLSPKVANTVKAIEKKGHSAGTPAAQAGQQQLPHIHTEDITLTLNKGDCCRVDKTCAYLSCITPQVRPTGHTECSKQNSYASGSWSWLHTP